MNLVATSDLTMSIRFRQTSGVWFSFYIFYIAWTAGISSPSLEERGYFTDNLHVLTMLFSCRVHLRITWCSAIFTRCIGYRPVRCHRKYCLWPYLFHVLFLETHNALLVLRAEKTFHKLGINGRYGVLILWFIFWRHFDERILHGWSIGQ